MSNLIGQSLGRYHILEQLGEGGMAIVYKAFDTRLETDVAVKVIRTENLAPSVLERSLKRFEREAKALAKLNHPNIVKVIDYGEYGGKPYLVMPYLPGGTLKSRIKNGALPWPAAVALIIPIARALEYAHRLHVIHRDVKPSNILLTGGGHPMLSDFGIAKVLDTAETSELTGTGIGLGTPEYMSPEQFQGRADARSDIYALGVVLYEIVTGRKPFVADTPAALIIKQATDPLPRPRQFVRNLPESLEMVLFKALAKQPRDRYQNMGIFVSALEQLLLAYQKQVAIASRPKRASAAVVKREETNKAPKTTTPFPTVIANLVKNIKISQRQIRFAGVLLLSSLMFLGLWRVIQQPFFNSTLASPNLNLDLPFASIKTLTPTTTATLTPSQAPTPTITLTPSSTSTKFPTQTPYGQNLLPIKRIVRRATFDEFDDVPKYFSIYGKYSIATNVISLQEPLVSGDPWKDGEAGLVYTPIKFGYGYTLLFRIKEGTNFAISFDSIGTPFGSSGYRAFIFGGGQSWLLYTGANLNLSIPLRALRSNPDKWYCLFMRFGLQGVIEARFWEKESPERMEKFQTEIPKDWAVKLLNYHVSIGEGVIEVDEFQEVEMLSDEPLP